MGVERAAMIYLGAGLNNRAKANVIHSCVISELRRVFPNMSSVRQLWILDFGKVLIRFNKLDRDTLKPCFNDTGQTDRFYSQGSFFFPLEMWDSIESYEEIHITAGWVMSEDMTELESAHLVCIDGREVIWSQQLGEILPTVPDYELEKEEDDEPIRTRIRWKNKEEDDTRKGG
jgi:hypothetical protein